MMKALKFMRYPSQYKLKIKILIISSVRCLLKDRTFL